MDNAPILSRILCIDFGLRRIGLALSDPLKTFAYPYKTILNDKNLIINLNKIVELQQVEKIILGFPTKEDGSDSHVTKNVIKFKLELEKKFNIEVILWDERYSSSIAQELIIESVSKKSKRREKGLVDRGAAAVILQEYLNSL
ncbi:MAG: Holliday junction resolvase RuvX [Ignavibacteriaceae bacterium]|nr:Holliday junction resolvase RuvX [Ignavibacteriaceae bacterium]